MDTVTSAPAPIKRARTQAQLYRDLNGVWPGSVPRLTEAEAKRAARLLYHRFFRKGRVKVEISNRISYAQLPMGGLVVVNPARQGWREMVHSLSHRFHGRLRPRDKGHGDNHRTLELEMIRHVIASGWLDGKLIPKPRAKAPAKPKHHPRVVEHERVVARIKAWTTKAKRAETALKKLHKEEQRLRKQLPLFTLDNTPTQATAPKPPKPPKKRATVWDLPAKIKQAVEKYADRVEEARVENDGFDGPRRPYSVWIDLKQGWRNTVLDPGAPIHSIHEPRIGAIDSIIEQLAGAEPCTDSCCIGD